MRHADGKTEPCEGVAMGAGLATGTIMNSRIGTIQAYCDTCRTKFG